jgi:hypothetical protein
MAKLDKDAVAAGAAVLRDTEEWCGTWAEGQAAAERVYLAMFARQATEQPSDDVLPNIECAQCGPMPYTHDDRCPLCRKPFPQSPPTPNKARQPSDEQLREQIIADLPEGQPSDDAVERLGEALFVLSDRLRASGVLSASDPVHQAYEGVVAAFQPLAAMQSTDTEAVIGELAEALEGARAVIVAIPISAMAGRIVNGAKIRNYATAKASLESHVEQIDAALAKLKERGQPLQQPET